MRVEFLAVKLRNAVGDSNIKYLKNLYLLFKSWQLRLSHIQFWCKCFELTRSNSVRRKEMWDVDKQNKYQYTFVLRLIGANIIYSYWHSHLVILHTGQKPKVKRGGCVKCYMICIENRALLQFLYPYKVTHNSFLEFLNQRKQCKYKCWAARQRLDVGYGK